MSKEEKRVPEVRFEGFHDDWKQRKLSDMVDTVKSYALSRSFETEKNTGTKYIHYGDIHTKKADKITNKSSIPNIKVGNYEYLRMGDVIIADASEDYQGIAMPAVIFEETVFNIVAGLHTIVLRPHLIDPIYLYYLFYSNSFRKYGYRVGTGMKVFGISKSNVLKFQTLFPSMTEQVRISTLLVKLDNAIALHQEKLAKLQSLKKAALQNLFPQKDETEPKVRFAYFSSSWQQRKLNELTIYQNGKGHEKKQFNQGDFELVNLNSISIDGGLKPSGKFINEAEDTLNKNDLVMVLSDVGHGDLLGRVALIPENNRFVLNQRVALLRPNKSVSPEFLFFYINTHQRYFKSQGAGMSQLNISKSSVENFANYIPVYEEQIKIGQTLKKLDDLITLHQQKLEKLQNLKKAFLQKMFI
ncbi:Type I restriction-modification system,specificity subunit S [Tetragenococcus halophilus subsp. halophilus]|uniref:Type I restriction-modification system,specificity subunit S n=1 Tax=Tetragenococcus halophilus subsp. halophilus TaxID=1513897 RepID=A0A2H6CRC7_TETHA|nr:restriction endonuclease subunit S [Tetragenococcus halophilus]GBD67543.1 Type I restriction-modification system,specificity subunit S [Tetragenococcus halophilus subsp. halophilus]